MTRDYRMVWPAFIWLVCLGPYAAEDRMDTPVSSSGEKDGLRITLGAPSCFFPADSVLVFKAGMANRGNREIRAALPGIRRWALRAQGGKEAQQIWQATVDGMPDHGQPRTAVNLQPNSQEQPCWLLASAFKSSTGNMRIGLPLGSYRMTLTYKGGDDMSPEEVQLESFDVVIGETPECPSKTVTENGLSVALHPTKLSWYTRTQFAFFVTLQNVSEKPFRLQSPGEFLVGKQIRLGDWEIKNSCERMPDRYEVVLQPQEILTIGSHPLPDLGDYAVWHGKTGKETQTRKVSGLRMPTGILPLQIIFDFHDGSRWDKNPGQLPPYWSGQITTAPLQIDLGKAYTPDKVP